MDGNENFEKSFWFLMDLEGGYSNIAADVGGETKFGISKRSYPDVDIKNLTADAAKGIYWSDFWAPLALDEVSSWRVAAEVFEMSVHGGKRWGVRLTQQALNMFFAARDQTKLIEDGLMGPKTLGALNNVIDHDGERKLIAAINLRQGIRLVHLAESNPKAYGWALIGWLRRLTPVGMD